MSRATTRSADRVLWMDGKRKARSGFKKSRLFIPAFLTFLVIVSALFYVWSRIKVIQFGYEISNSLKEGRMLEETNKKLRLEVATLKSYARLEKIAVDELKMSKPKSDQVIIIR